ncbi:MAG: hypothetical protein AAF206_29915 [Bacteroidota bacterium]
MMLNALVIHNHIEGLTPLYQSNDQVHYDFAYVSKDFDPNLDPYELLIVPCGSDHLAMLKIKNKVKAFLDQGKALFCFDGWFTDWIPGNRWIMNNEKKTIDVRYHIEDDPHSLFEGIDLDQFNFSNGISGWWACGYIEPASEATVLLADTWDRPMLVLDEASTSGTMILTASGPLADKTYATTDDFSSEKGLAKLYHQFLTYVIQKQNKRQLLQA